MIGGRILGRGAYGCTFFPAPRCAGGTVFTNSVGKVVQQDSHGSDEAMEELRIGQKIMRLPNASEYFALPTKGCVTEQPLSDPDTNKCSSIKPKEPTFLLAMPFAGQTLERVAMDRARIARIFKPLLIHLLEGAILYQSEGYVHNDIHIENILVDNKDVGRIIDFGLAFRPTDVRRWDEAHLSNSFDPKSNYIWQPPEVLLMMMIRNRIPTILGVRTIKLHNPQYYVLELQFPTRKSLEVAMDENRRTARKDLRDYIRTNAKGFDAWRLGITMWIVWNDLLRWPPFRQVAPTLYADRGVRAVLGGLTDFDPRTRLSLEKALERLR